MFAFLEQISKGNGGHIPCPYNAKELDQRPGVVYLCEGPIDTLTLVEKGFAAVGVPGVAQVQRS